MLTPATQADLGARRRRLNCGHCIGVAPSCFFPFLYPVILGIELDYIQGSLCHFGTLIHVTLSALGPCDIHSPTVHTTSFHSIPSLTSMGISRTEYTGRSSSLFPCCSLLAASPFIPQCHSRAPVNSPCREISEPGPPESVCGYVFQAPMPTHEKLVV
jgi:hypothetical protein